MLTIHVPLSENFNEMTSEFVVDSVPLDLEHSLASLSKWESKFNKPFLSADEKTDEETLFYIENCMLLTKNPPEGIFTRLSKGNIQEIQDYINGTHTATWIKERPGSPKVMRQIITAEVIYGWMVGLKIPFEAEHWHLNRLFTFIRVCNEQKTPPKKMGRADAARQRAELNAQRQAQWGTRG